MSWLIFFIISFHLHARVYETDIIEVIPSKDIERFTFGDTTIISAAEIEKSSTTQVKESMSKIPGLIISQSGGPGSASSFFIRGTESGHTSITLDGLKMNDTSNPSRQFDSAFFTSPFLREVAVHKGPQAVLFGSDAMGGIINLETRKGDNPGETRLTINGGSFGTREGSLSTDWEKSSHRGTLTYTNFHSDGISRRNKKRFGATEKDSADITQIASSSEHHWTPKIKTAFFASYLNGKNELDDFNSDSSQSHSVNDQYILQQKTSLEIDKKSAASLRYGVNRHQRILSNSSQSEAFYNGNLHQNEFLYRREEGRLGIISGVVNEYENSSTDDLRESSLLNSVFIQSAYKMGNLKMHAGGRLDEHSRYDEFLTGSSGLAYKRSKNIFSLQYSQGFKAPSLYQLFAPPFTGYPMIGNPDLVPETNHFWEASWKHETSSYGSGITFFQNRLSNLITFTNAGYMNQGRFIAEGIEANAKWKGPKAHLAGSFTHQNFRKEEVPVLRRPTNTGQIQISYFLQETLESSLTSRWYSARDDEDLNGEQVKLNSFEVLDVGLKKSWARNDLGIEIKNILNREYEELYGFSVLPRSVFVHYGHRFQ